jgi:hypothetical protein
VSLTGSVLFYNKPELLSKEQHGSLGVNPAPTRFGFASKAHIVPLTVPEFGPASLSYPIIFVGDLRQPAVAMGLQEGQNLFANEAIGFDLDAYIPCYIRRYPFVLAGSEDNTDRMLVGIDRSYEYIAENAGYPFFADGEPTEYTKQCIQFCNDFETQNRMTQSFVTLLNDMDLFETRTATYTPQNADGTQGEPQTVAQFFAVSETKLNALPADKLAELRSNGALAQIYAHLNSLFGWERLIIRAMERTQAEQTRGAANA